MNWPNGSSALTVDEPLRMQRVEIVLSGDGWVLQSHANGLHGLEKDRLRQMELMDQELVRMLRFNPPSAELVDREVLEIGSYDEVGMALDGGSEDMAIIWIRQLQHIDEFLEIRHQRIAHMRVHEISRSFEPSA
jgi:hypothetical protein